jgi:4-hydroxy-2-oxoheptanedioate aldolase
LSPTTLRGLWDSRSTTLGGWLALPDSFSAEIVSRTGFDWVLIDMQHGLIGYSDLLAMLQGISTSGLPALVRTQWNDESEIMKALDAGAQGVVVPMVNSPEDARKAVRACRYPPLGIRSWGPTRVAMHHAGYDPTSANKLTVCVIMIETVDAVRRIDDILDVPGIDGVFIGPNDLGVSAGLPPTADPTDGEHMHLIESILNTCQKRGTIAGIACGSPDLARKWSDRGFQMLAAPSEASLLREAAQNFCRQAGRDIHQRGRGDGYT